MFYLLTTLSTLETSTWTLFIGRFHPVLVHLPIGFLLIAALLEIGRYTGKINVSSAVNRFILLWSAVSATLACVAGYLLSMGGGYDEMLLQGHMWKGIGVAAFAWIAWLVQSGVVFKISSGRNLVYLLSFGLALLLTLTAGHDGGSLTHGDDYLTRYMPEPMRSLAGMEPVKSTIEIKPLADWKQAVVFEEIVQPILEARCTQCHNASKKKGNLRMDELSLLLHGGDGGPALIPGKSLESDMIRRCLLDESDDDHMPPKGKPQLTNDQIALIGWWIDQGAPAEKRVSELTVSEEIKPLLASLGNAGKSGSEKEAAMESAIASLKVAPAKASDIEALRRTGVTVKPLSLGQNLLEVNAVNADHFGEKEVALLLPLAEQITWLKLGKTRITDASLGEIAKLKNLTRLYLEHTGIGDKGIAAIKALPYLEYLNLIATKVSDTGLKDAAAMTSLRSVYIWQSAITDSVASGIGREKPGLEIIDGIYKTEVVPLTKNGL